MDGAHVLKTVFVGNRPTKRQLRKGRLVVVGGAEGVVGRFVSMDRTRIRVGRSAVNDLRLEESSVSGVHCELVSTEDGLVLRDLGSTNGTWAGDLRVLEAQVAPGSTFRAGNVVLRYEGLEETVDIPLAADDRFGGVFGSSVPMREVFATLEKVAPSDLTVLVEGETGTGKEVVARAIHDKSRRANRPFVVLDCSAIPDTLAESTLFGHEQGAFTGAVQRHKGAFEQADGGTVFLDEIGELPLDLQPKLLRVLENQEVKRVGGNKTISVDTRLVAATNRDLRRMVAEGTFREDLYFRVSVIHVELPPLRRRPDDVPMLAALFLDKCENPRFGGAAPTILPKGMVTLMGHPWPGNVRELRNVVERAVSLADGPELGPDDFFPGSRGPLAMPSLGSLRPPMASIMVGGGAAGGTDVDLDVAFKSAKQLIVDAWEVRYLGALMAEHNGNISAASRASGLTRYHLRELLKKHQLSGRGGVSAGGGGRGGNGGNGDDA